VTSAATSAATAVSKRSAAEIVDELAALPDKTQVTVYAPKAENRKGEFRDLLADARKAGFVRVRIDGMVVRLEDVEALDKQKRHAIELVIDRLSISAADRGRLTDSVETALREGKGKLMIEVAGERTPRVYSEDNACARCGIGFPELSPQSFSFNSPLGMCVTCNGLGEKLQADPELIVPDPTRSIRDGAVAVWGDSMAKDSGWTANIVKALAKAFKIDLDKPWSKLQRQAPRPAHARHRRQARHGGVGGQALERRVGHAVRGHPGPARAPPSRVELGPRARLLRVVLPRGAVRRPATAPACARSRARCSSPTVDHRRHRHDGASDATQFVTGLKLTGTQGADRRRGAQGDPQPPDVPARRRPRLPDARSRRRRAVGRRGAAHPPGVAARLASCRACCTCSTSRRSACTSATTSG
jgi:hypothetical protein